MADLSVSNTVLQMVLAQANKSQNQHYPPSVFEAHYSLVTHSLIDEAAKNYPGTQSIIDLISPYFKKELVMVKNGIAPFPARYRHLLGYGIYLKDEKVDESCQKFDKDPSEKDLQELILQAQLESKDVTPVSIGRWNTLTTHRYKKPKLDKPIACIFDADGIKVSPLVPFLEIRYIIKTEPFKYGYIQNPDDTYYFDPKTTTEAKWKENAISFLFKGVNILYSNFVRDPEHTASARDLKEAGLF